MKPVHASRFRFAAALLGLAVAGCSSATTEVDTLPRVAVSGSITLDGKPLPEGKLQFQPDAASTGIIAIGEIKDGRFSIDRASGPVPGTYRVMVSGRPVFKIKAGAEPGGGPPNAGPDPVPKWYNVKTSPLEAKVTADSPQSFEFTMNSKKP